MRRRAALRRWIMIVLTLLVVAVVAVLVYMAE